MNAVPTKQILTLHLFVTLGLFVIAVLICTIWLAILSQPDRTEDRFKNSETLQLLQIVIGFTYVSVINSFFKSLADRTSLVAEIRTLYSPGRKLPPAFVNMLIGNHDYKESWSYYGQENPKDLMESWEYWEGENVDAKWKQIFTKVVVQANADHGQLFNFLGPWMALAVFYLFHPAVAYTDDSSANVLAWMFIYSASICILFAFLVTMWFVERGAEFKYLCCFNKNGCLYSTTLKCYMEHATRHLISEARPDSPAVTRGVDYPMYTMPVKKLKL